MDVTNTALVNLRHELHRHPEVSGKEYKTSASIMKFMERCKPDEAIRLGDAGLAFVFRGSEGGSSVVYRAELDALPITETGNSEYKSKVAGTSHACGHDGHMAILAGLGLKIADNKPQKGTAILLFQPAEETGQGAKAIMEDPDFRALQAERIFALHNLPGFPAGEVLIRDGVFAAASSGMVVTLKGKTSHAGEPEKGINPDRAISKLIEGIHLINAEFAEFTDLAFATIVHIVLGERAFGTSPGHGEVCLTIRAYNDRDHDQLRERLEKLATQVSREENLKHEIIYTEVFPATKNSVECTTLIQEAAESKGLSVRILNEPFRWTEDFGYYTQEIGGGFFGLGAGTDRPALHHPDYDFPDELIDTGTSLFFALYQFNHLT
ncbi:MAG: amidohydrolase [Spirochaetales bacterium]|jgi:amidohydrolase|nr:amidohydrolase [Spirochaetales bacterium]